MEHVPYISHISLYYFVLAPPPLPLYSLSSNNCLHIFLSILLTQLSMKLFARDVSIIKKGFDDRSFPPPGAPTSSGRK